MIKLNSGHSIPALGFGVYELDKGQASSLVYDALKNGYRHVDTAEYYENEREVAQGFLKWIGEGHGKRSDAYLTTKVLSPEGYDHVVKAVTESLEKTKGLEYLDLVLLHSPLTNKEKRLASWKALQEFVDKGLVKSIGVSNYGVHHIKELQDWSGLKYLPAVNQIEISPWLRREELVDYCHGLGIEVEAYSPLTRGYRLGHPDLVRLAGKYNKTPAQFLIKWSLQKGFIALVKSNSSERQKENFDVADFEISKEDLEALKDEHYVSEPHWDPSTYTG